MASTKNRRNFRPPFDPDRNFITSKAMAVSGKRLGPGDPFDKASVTSRRLRQLYEQRTIQFTDDESRTEGETPKRVVAIGPTDRSLNAVPGGVSKSLPRIRRKKSDVQVAVG